MTTRRANDTASSTTATAAASLYANSSSRDTMSTGAISVSPRLLLLMKMTDPYSPTARAKARVNPVRVGGTSRGKSTRRNVCHLLAPRVPAACSVSLSSSASTG